VSSLNWGSLPLGGCKNITEQQASGFLAKSGLSRACHQQDIDRDQQIKTKLLSLGALAHANANAYAKDQRATVAPRLRITTNLPIQIIVKQIFCWHFATKM